MNLRWTFGSLMGLLLLLWPGAARSAQEPQVRVLLAQAAALRVVPVAGSSLTLRDGRGRLLGQRDEGLTLRASRGRIAGVSGEPQLLWLLPEQPNGSFWLQQRRYRGALLVQLKEGRLQAINRLGVESYLPSVVGAEMPHQWPDEALRVQSVAARTYALRQLRPGADYDLDSTQRSQVYLGLESETPSTRSAVASTRAQVLTHGSRLIEAVFHSSSGGRTENSGEIWRNQLPYLKSVPDFDQISPVYRWSKPLDAEQLLEAFSETGGAEQIEAVQRTSTGRLKRVVVRGPGGEIELPARELRRRLKLKSTYVRFDPPEPSSGPFGDSEDWLNPAPGPQPKLIAKGRGFGHGVGMSQWGAYGLSLQGKGYAAILRHYYPGAKLDLYQAPSAWPKPPPQP